MLFFSLFSLPRGEGLSHPPLREKSSISEELSIHIFCSSWRSPNALSGTAPACARPSSRQHGCSRSQTASPDSAGSLPGPFSWAQPNIKFVLEGLFWGGEALQSQSQDLMLLSCLLHPICVHGAIPSPLGRAAKASYMQSRAGSRLRWLPPPVKIAVKYLQPNPRSTHGWK